MLRALGRVAGIKCRPLEASSALQAACPASTLTCLRLFASAAPDSGSGGDAGTSKSAPAGGASGAGSSGSPRLGGKEWRSWIDTKLDSELQAIKEERAPAAAATAPAAQQPAAAAAPAAPPRPVDQPRTKAASGWELEQQIYSIVAAPRPTEEGQFPQGVTGYAQLAMANDAPRFGRSGAHVADVSPQRLHPSRLFIPQQTYAPSELDPYKAAEEGPAPWEEAENALPTLNPHEVTQLADYKNAPMLSTFLSEAGKLPLRKRTHLRAKLHRHLARQVKIARCMAILSPTARWQPAVDAKEEAARERRQRRRQQRL
ncbi:hypothetical protein ABPG75_003921 [Micractinium tetrahymenae]